VELNLGNQNYNVLSWKIELKIGILKFEKVIILGLKVRELRQEEGGVRRKQS
jgi:hypothetical protein